MEFYPEKEEEMEGRLTSAAALLANEGGIIKERRGRGGEYTSLGGNLEVRGRYRFGDCRTG